MARLFTSGFELQSVTNAVEWDTFSGTPAIDTTTKRSGAAALRLQTSASTKYARHQVTGAGGTEIFVRVLVNFATLPSATEDILAILDNVLGGFVSWRVTSTGTHVLYDGGNAVNLDTDATTLSTGVWYRFELRLETSGTTWSWEWKLDGTSLGSGTLSTPGSGGSLFVNLGTVASPWVGGTGASTYDVYFDDVAVNDPSGSVQTSWPGDGKVVHLKPDGAGDAAATAGLYTAIDEVTPNDVTDFIEIDTDAGGQQANYTFEASSVPGIGASDTITLVHVGVRHRAETAASMSYTPQIKSQSGGTTFDGTATTHNDTTWRTNGDAAPRVYRLTSYTDPQGGGAWTPTLLDGIIAGVNVTDGNPDVHISTLWVVVEYVPSAGPTQRTKTFTVDGIIKAIQTSTFTVDGVLVSRVSNTFTIDGIIKAIQTNTFTVDGIIKATQSKTFTVDAIIKAVQTSGFTVDGLIVSRPTQTFTIDGIIFATQTNTFTVDGIIIGGSEATFTIDGIIRSSPTFEFTVDGFIRTMRYMLGGYEIPRPRYITRRFIEVKDDITTINGRLTRDRSNSEPKEVIVLRYEILSQNEVSTLLTILNLNRAVSFAVNDGELVIPETTVFPRIPDREYNIQTADYRESLELELHEVS